MLDSDNDAAVDADESNDEAGNFKDSDDNDDDLISEHDEFDEWSDWEMFLDESVLNNGFLSKTWKCLIISHDSR